MEYIIEKISSTMIIERLISCMVYLFFLLFYFSKIKNSKSHNKIKKYLNYYLVILTIMGFLFIPDPSKDLYRWLTLSEGWKNLPIKDFITDVAFASSTPIAYIYIYLARLTNINGILPAFCSFIFHYNIFSIIKKTSEKYHYSGKAIAISLLFFMCMGRLLEAISGVRSMVAVSILANCFVTELIKGRFLVRTIILEIIACMIHPLAIAVYALRLLFVSIQKDSRPLVRVATIITTIILIIAFIKFGPSYLTATVDKADSYLSFKHYTYIWEYMIAAAMWVFCFKIISSVRKKISEGKDYFLRNLLTLSSLFLFATLLCVIQYSMFHRLVSFTCMIVLPLVPYCYDRINSKFSKNMALFLWAIMAIVILRGDLCGYMMFKIS